MSFANLLKILSSALDILTKFMKTHGKKALTILLCCILATIVICVINNQILIRHINTNLESFRTDVKEDMLSTLAEYERVSDSIRYVEEVNAIKNQAAMKSMLKKFRSELDADYILVCQFHNNVSSLAGVQFIKFDATFNVHKNGLSSIDIDEFQNTSVTKYDLIPYLWDRKIVECSLQELSDIDELFYGQVRKFAPTVSKIVFTHLTIKDTQDGVIMYMFNKNTAIDYLKIAECTTQLNDWAIVK